MKYFNFMSLLAINCVSFSNEILTMNKINEQAREKNSKFM